MSRARRAGALLAVALAGACLVPAAAGAEDVTGAQFRELARRAQSDPGALYRLQNVDRVDGRPVDVAGALRRARGPELGARLRTLAEDAGGGSPAAGDPRADARDVLSEQRFRQSHVPGPFRGLIDRLGRWLPSFRGPLDWLDDLLPGGRPIVWLLLGGLVAGLAAALSRRVLARRVRAAKEAAAEALPPRDDARALERQADAAEAAGELEAALRLRFRAGLIRLDAHGAIVFRPSVSTREVRRALRSHDFDALAGTFDEVVYGRRPAEHDDVEAARERWPSVVSSAPRDRTAA